MGHQRRVLDKRFATSEEQQSAAASTKDSHETAIGEKATENMASPEELSGMRLIYALMTEDGNVVGNPTGPFAFFNEMEGILCVVSKDNRDIQHLSLDRMIGSAMGVAQGLEASFIVHGGQVICNIRGFSKAGTTYGEAASRALLAYARDDRN